MSPFLTKDLTDQLTEGPLLRYSITKRTYLHPFTKSLSGRQLHINKILFLLNQYKNPSYILQSDFFFTFYTRSL